MSAGAWTASLTADGKQFRVLNIVDDVIRECLAAIPERSIPGRLVAREQTDTIEWCGKPGMIVCDNGTQFTANAILGCCKATRSSGVTSHRAS